MVSVTSTSPVTTTSLGTTVNPALSSLLLNSWSCFSKDCSCLVVALGYLSWRLSKLPNLLAKKSLTKLSIPVPTLVDGRIQGLFGSNLSEPSVAWITDVTLALSLPVESTYTPFFSSRIMSWESEVILSTIACALSSVSVGWGLASDEKSPLSWAVICSSVRLTSSPSAVISTLSGVIEFSMFSSLCLSSLAAFSLAALISLCCTIFTTVLESAILSSAIAPFSNTLITFAFVLSELMI